MWATDDEGTITFSNAAGAELLGHEDLVGRSLADLTHEEDRRASAPEGWAGVVRRLHADGACGRSTRARSAPARAGRASTAT